MIPSRWFGVYVSIVCLLWLGISLVLAQTTAPAGQTPVPAGPGLAPGAPEPPAGSAPSIEGPVRPETVAARKATAQTRLEALAQLLLSQDEAEALRATLEQQLKVLVALDAAFHKRTTYVAQLDSLPQQIQQLNTERQALAARAPRHFAAVDEKLRLDHEAQLQGIRAELDGWRKELTMGELRLAGIARDIEQHVTSLAQSEKDLLIARNEAARATEYKALLLARAELFDLRHQLQQTEIDMLEAEREWLAQQGPLRDVQIGLAQTRYAVLQQDLEVIKSALDRAISQESSALASGEEDIVRQLLQSTDPTEIVKLKVQFETIKVRQVTADYRQQLNALGAEVSTQEQRNAHEKQEAEHLASLVEKYVSGERIAQRLQAAFTRLRREQARYGEAPMQVMEINLDALTDQELDLEERLYDFDRRADLRLREVTVALQALTAAQREAQLTRVRKALDEQKTMLREQKQALRALVQEQTKLITLHREFRRLLEEGNQFIHTRLFWLRDGQTMSARLFHDAVLGAVVTARRLQAAFLAELASIPSGQEGALRFWLLVGVIGVGLPWVALRIQTRLRGLATSLLAAERPQSMVSRRSGVALLLVAQTAIWPAYIALVAWAWPSIIMAGRSVIDLELPLMASVQWSALVLWCWLAGRALIRYQGWSGRAREQAQQEEQTVPQASAIRQELQRTITVGGVATLLFLVPRYLLLHASGGPDVMAGSQALARLCFTMFQVVLLVLLAMVGRRGSRLMTALLARHRQAPGLIWRNWPLLYIVLLAVMSTAFTLDALGYHYASRTLWLRLGQTLLVILVLVQLDHKISALLDRLAPLQPALDGRAPAPLSPHLRAVLNKGRPFLRVGLMLVGLLMIEYF